MSCINLVNNTTENNITLSSDRVNVEATTKTNIETNVKTRVTVSAARGPSGTNGNSEKHSFTTIETTYTGVELPLITGINEGDTCTAKFIDGTICAYTYNGDDWVLIFSKEPTSKLFPSEKAENIRFATAIIRPVIDLLGNVTWIILAGSDHGSLFFAGISTPNSSIIRISYPETSLIYSFYISCDETFQKYGIVGGASVGLSYADISLTTQYQLRQIITYNGASWSNAGVVFCNAVNSGNNIVITASPTLSLGEYTYANTPAMYAGTNNRIIRQVYSGLGYGQTIYQLINPVTGITEAPNANDIIILWNPKTSIQLNTQTINTNSGLERHIYDADYLPNLWIIGIYEL